MKTASMLTKFSALLLAVLLTVSCDNLFEDGGLFGGGSTFTEQDEYLLADFSASGVPSSDTWVITDVEAGYYDFEGLRGALATAYEDGRQITLIFQNMVEMPGFISGVSNSGVLSSCDAIVAIELPEMTMLGGRVFNACGGLVSIDAPKLIEGDEFVLAGCTSLISVNMPELLTVGYGMFSSCSSLEVIKLPKATTTGPSPFWRCSSLTDVDIPQLVTLGYDAFYQCDALESVELPKVVDMSSEAFAYCDNLVEVSLPEVVTIGYNAFYQCPLLSAVELPKATELAKNIFYDCDSLCSIELPEATSIGSFIFSECNNLSSISLPKLASIGQGAFINCGSLESLDIPSTVTSIGGGAFNGCAKLTELNIDLPDFIYEDGMLYNSDRSTLISILQVYAPQSLESDSITSVESYAGSYCDKLTTINLPNNTHLNEYAFTACDVLTDVYLPKTIGVEPYAFNRAGNLTTIYLATDPGLRIKYLYYGSFASVSSSRTTLYIGADNEDIIEEENKIIIFSDVSRYDSDDRSYDPSCISTRDTEPEYFWVTFKDIVLV